MITCPACGRIFIGKNIEANIPIHQVNLSDVFECKGSGKSSVEKRESKINERT